VTTDDSSALPLYLTRFADLPARLSLRTGEELQVGITGEIIFAGAKDDTGQLQARAIMRLSIWSDKPIDQLDGQLAIAGPRGLPELQLGPDGEAIPFETYASYPLLNKLEPHCTTFDAHYPELETLSGQLQLKVLDIRDDGRRATVRVLLDLNTLTDAVNGAGLVTRLRFEPSEVDFDFRLMGDEPQPLAISLAGPCSAPPHPVATGNSHYILDAGLHFVNYTATAVDSLASQQLAGACEVWWRKGGIRMQPLLNVDTRVGAASLGPGGHTLPVTSADASNGVVEVYFVDSLQTIDQLSGAVVNIGGIAYNCRTPQAYVILTISEAQNNRYLLAHELGHVLGLTHPTGAASGSCATIPPGDSCSVMVPDSPNSNRNTLLNITTASAALPLASVITAPGGTCGWNVDTTQGFFHIIRDFPYDDGEAPSVAAAPHPNHYAYSDVWSAPFTPTAAGSLSYNIPAGVAAPPSTAMFHPDFTPNHFTPTWGGPNYMYVRLHTCQLLTSAAPGVSPVPRAHLFLAVPGVSTRPLVRLTPAAGLAFGGTSGPTPGRYPSGAKLRSVSWSVPAGYPAHCCVLAVAVSDIDRADPVANQINTLVSGLPVTAPGAPILGTSFFTFAPYLTHSNDVAQRNLNITTVPQPVRLIWLSGISIANIFEHAAALELLIETPPGAGVEQLALELDGAIVQTWRPDGPLRFLVGAQVAPGAELTLRIGVLLGDSLPGDGLPIDIGIVVDGQPLAGYRHLLVAGTPKQAMDRGLDTLSGALRDVGLAFQIEQATTLARQVRRLVRRRSSHDRRERNSLRKLANQLEQLTKPLAANGHPQALAVWRRIDELVDLLNGARVQGSLATRIQEIADCIQQAAGPFAAPIPDTNQFADATFRLV
jgi:hypothetical protein